MRRPSSMALTMDAKLSSVRTMSAAPFATSEPVIPMAMPTSAACSEGASLTPSPVMAQKPFLRCKAAIMRVLVDGAQRAITRGRVERPSISDSDKASNSAAVLTMESAVLRGRDEIVD